MMLYAVAASAASTPDFTVFLGAGNDYRLAQVVTDAAGNSYIAGNRFYPASSPTYAGQKISDVFIAKLDSGGRVIFLRTMGGKGSDVALAVAVDPAGNIYLAGSTMSENFPLHTPLQSKAGTLGTGFLVKLDTDGNRVIYSTYFSGTLGSSLINAIAVDASGNAYVTDATSSRDFPSTQRLPDVRDGAFIAKISAGGEKVVYAGVISGHRIQCVGGSSCDFRSRYTTGVGIALDAAGNAYIAGNTETLDLPTTPGALIGSGLGAFCRQGKRGGNIPRIPDLYWQRKQRSV